MRRAAPQELVDMAEKSNPSFAFPELPDQAAAALDQFLEDFYYQFQQHYGVQLYRWYRALDEREARRHRLPSPPLPTKDPPF
jgi:hypothetical protein